MDGNLERPPLTGGASIYPFCWSILLAARERGLGGVMTTFLSRVEPEAAPELGLPEHHALAATIFVGVPERQVTKLRREPVEAIRHAGPVRRAGVHRLTPANRHRTIMEVMETPVNLQAALATVDAPWTPLTVAVVNDYDVRVVKVDGDFTWHSHPETDELFIVCPAR